MQHGGFVVKNNTSDEPMLEIMTDADWSGDSITRKSVSGVVALLDGHFLFSGSRTQRVVSLSSAESELYAMVSGLCDAMHLKHVIMFCLGLDKLTIHHLGDSSAARGILQRQGTGGRVKHIEGRLLWSQQKIQEKIVVLNVVQTRWNLSDMATKALSAGRIKMLKGLLGYRNEDNESIGAEDLEEELSRIHARGAIRQLRMEMSKVMSGASSGVAKQFLQMAVLQSLVTKTLGDALSCGETDVCRLDEQPIVEIEEKWNLHVWMIVCVFVFWISVQISVFVYLRRRICQLREYMNAETASMRGDIVELADENGMLVVRFMANDRNWLTANNRLVAIDEHIDWLERYIISDFDEQTTVRINAEVHFAGTARRLSD